MNVTRKYAQFSIAMAVILFLVLINGLVISNVWPWGWAMLGLIIAVYVSVGLAFIWGGVTLHFIVYKRGHDGASFRIFRDRFVRINGSDRHNGGER